MELWGLSRAPLPADGPGPFSASSFKRLIQTLGEAAARSAGMELSDISGASLAMPGPFDYRDGISKMKHKLQSLYNVDLKGGDCEAVLLGAGAGAICERRRGLYAGRGGRGRWKGFREGHRHHAWNGYWLRVCNGWADCDSIGPAGRGSGGSSGRRDLESAVCRVDGGGVCFEARLLRGQFQKLTGVEAEVATIAAAAKGDEPCPDWRPRF